MGSDSTAEYKYVAGTTNWSNQYRNQFRIWNRKLKSRTESDQMDRTQNVPGTTRLKQSTLGPVWDSGMELRSPELELELELDTPNWWATRLPESEELVESPRLVADVTPHDSRDPREDGRKRPRTRDGCCTARTTSSRKLRESRETLRGGVDTSATTHELLHGWRSTLLHSCRMTHGTFHLRSQN